MLNFMRLTPYTICATAAVGAFGVFGFEAWTFPTHDSGETTGPVSFWRLQWGGGPQSSQVPLWAPQSTGWEGKPWNTCCDSCCFCWIHKASTMLSVLSQSALQMLM